MPKYFIFLLLLFPTLSLAQPKEIIENYCDCSTYEFYNFIEDEDCSITFIRVEGRNYFGSRLFIETIEAGPNNTWQQVERKEIIFDNISASEEERARGFEDYYDRIFPTEEDQQMRKISLNEKAYYYAILNIYKEGTAHSGGNQFLFVFHDAQKKEKPQVIYFEKWDSIYEGSWLQMGDLSEKQFELFQKQASIYIDEKFYANDDPYAWGNYLRKWKELNPNLHEELRKNKYYSANFLTFETDEFYKKMKTKFESRETENKDFRLFYSIFSPVFGYNKKTDESFIVYIPQAWPSGGAKSMRSVGIKKEIGNKVIFGNLYNNDENYEWTEVNLKTGQMRLVKLSEIEE